jgi:hypothetical protein
MRSKYVFLIALAGLSTVLGAVSSRGGDDYRLVADTLLFPPADCVTLNGCGVPNTDCLNRPDHACVTSCTPQFCGKSHCQDTNLDGCSCCSN